jgi:hypothetical protein
MIFHETWRGTRVSYGRKVLGVRDDGSLSIDWVGFEDWEDAGEEYDGGTLCNECDSEDLTSLEDLSDEQRAYLVSVPDENRNEVLRDIRAGKKIDKIKFTKRDYLSDCSSTSPEKCKECTMEKRCINSWTR